MDEGVTKEAIVKIPKEGCCISPRFLLSWFLGDC